MNISYIAASRLTGPFYQVPTVGGRFLAVLVLFAFGCGDAEQPLAKNSERVMRGDTSMVITRGEGLWGPAREPQEALRVTGISPQEPFGSLWSIAATPDGGVMVFDMQGAQGPALLQFDSSGTFIRKIGRQGGGPGEYRSGLVALKVGKDGTVYLFDSIAQRVLLYVADGVFLADIRVPFSSLSPEDLVPAATRGIYVRGARDPRLDAELIQYLRSGPGGRNSMPRRRYVAPPMVLVDTGRVTILDSLMLTPSDTSRELSWSVTSDGGMLLSTHDRVGFVLVAPYAGLATDEIASQRPLAGGEAVFDAVRYHPDERAERQRDIGDGGPEVPEFKSLSILSPKEDIDGRIWIRMSAPGQRIPPEVKYFGPAGNVMTEWTEPVRFAAFQRDGTFLGELTFPPKAKVSFVGNAAWVITTGADGESILVKYRIYE